MDTSARSNPILLAGKGAEPGPELRKPTEMIVMVPRSKRVTLTGRRIYNALLQVSQSRLAAMDAMPSADYLFEVPLAALLRLTGSNGDDRTAAKRYLREMQGLEVDWESTAPGDGVKWQAFHMLSEVALEVRNGENWVAWSFPPTIMAALREPHRWARIDLAMLASLSSYTAVALYEICARYRDNPSGRTSRKPVAWWADALSQAPPGTERREWRKFKNERVKSAIAEINRETDLEIELFEQREGRAITHAQFGIRKKRTAPRLNLDAGLVDANLAQRAGLLGVREIKFDELVREFGEDLVRQKLDLLEKRAANRKLRSVENTYSYLRSLLRNDGHDTPTESATPVVSAMPASSSNQAAPLETNTGVDRIKARFATLRAEIKALPPEQRQLYTDLALQELAEKNLLTAVISRRAASGDVLHGILGTFVLSQYGRARHGATWDQPAHPVGDSSELLA